VEVEVVVNHKLEVVDEVHQVLEAVEDARDLGSDMGMDVEEE